MRIKTLCSCGRLDCKCADKRTKKASKSDYRASNKELGYDKQWSKFSLLYRKRFPLCQQCELNGKTEIAVDVHHIVKLKDRPDLKYDVDNVMSVCRKCHKRLDAQ